MGNDFTSAQALFAGSNGPVATDFHVFASLYTALFTPFQSAVLGVIGTLLPLMAGAVTAGVGAMLVAWALTIAVGAESDWRGDEPHDHPRAAACCCGGVPAVERRYVSAVARDLDLPDPR